MGKTFLLDSNIVIYLIKGVLNADTSTIIAEAARMPARVSVITKMEVLGYRAPSDEERLKYEGFLADTLINNRNEEIVNKTIEIRKAYKIRLPDAIIAATAIVFDLVLITRNELDFNKITSLKIVNPFLE